MYCPECGEEFDDELLCPDCEEPLHTIGRGLSEDALEYAYIHMDEEPLEGLTEEQVAELRMERNAEDYLYREQF